MHGLKKLNKLLLHQITIPLNIYLFENSRKRSQELFMLLQLEI